MNEKTMNGKKAFRTALPVIIGLVLILLITVTITVASRPDYSASVDNPNGAYLTLDNYVITNDKVYVNLRYNYGVSEMLANVDKALLKDIKVDRNSEDYIAIKNELIYGEDHEDLTEKEKTKILEKYELALKIAGYKTEAEVNEYFDLEYRRTVYAKEAYKEYVKENGYDAETLEAGYLEMNKDKYNDSAKAIVITFDSEEEALAILELYGVDTEDLSTSTNWINKEKDTVRKELVAEIEELEEALEKATSQSEKDELNAEIAALEEEILALGAATVSTPVYFTELEIQQIFVDMYNFMNAFYTGGDVSDYYDENGKLNPKYNILVEDIHYEVVEKEVRVDPNDDSKLTTKKFIEIIDGAELNENCILNFTSEDATAINSTVNTYLFSTLKNDEDHYFQDSYTKKPISFSSGNTYFLAALLSRYEAQELEYDFDDEVDEDLKAPSEELLNEIKDYLSVEKFDDNILTQMLIELRAKNNFVIYDNFLEAMYQASYDNLYGTTLKMEDYPEYKVNKKNSKTLVYTLKAENGETIEMTAQNFFEELNEDHGPQIVLSIMSNYYVLSNPEFNELYNHVTGEIYDEEAFKEAIDTSLKNIKYYFNAGYYATSGFSADYGWNNFLRDYLRMDNEYELILNAAGTEDAFKNYYETTYTYEDIVEEMKKIYEENYYALSVINVLVYTDYNHDGNPDTYELDTDKENTYWTEKQEELAQELIEKVYQVAPSTGEDGLYNQLAAVANEYNSATYNDSIWGTYKKYGLKVKVEAAADYTNSSSLVEEFLDKLSEVYHEIELEGMAGITFDAPYQVEGSFPTEYGYHKIAITKTTDRPYAEEEPNKDLSFEELRDSQLALLTENVYKLYLEMQEDTFEDEKEDILAELGFEEDYELSEELQEALEQYYIPAVESLENEDKADLGFSYLRETAVNSGKYVFTNAADKEYYFEIEALVRQDLEDTIAGENE